MSALFVAFFTWRLVQLNNGLLKETEKAATAAKEAAEIAARTIVISHRPVLAVRPIRTDGVVGRRVLGRLRNSRTRVTNSGVSPVTLQNFWAEWQFHESLPLTNPAHDTTEGATPEIVLIPGQFHEFPIRDRDLTADEQRTIDNVADAAALGQALGASIPPARIGSLYLIGCVKYRDNIGLRRMYFARRFDPTSARFELVDDPHYSYEE